jgi:site-specific DNA-methyltransferase (adenine-specific)/modification methylase
MSNQISATVERREHTPFSARIGSPVPFYDHDGITIYCGDNREILPTLGEYDLLLTDPPYELGEGWKRWGRDTSRRRLWTGENPEWDKLDAPTLEAAILKCRQQIIWGGNLYPLPPTRSWLSWDKMQKHNGADFELAWTNLEIPAKTFRMQRADAYINKAETKKCHPTEKPLQLMSWCLNHTPKVQTILDPWMGSGTTLVAAKQRGLRAIGIEINETYCRSAVARLAQDVLGLENAPHQATASTEHG